MSDTERQRREYHVARSEQTRRDQRMRGDSAPPIVRSEQDQRALLDRLERMRVPPAEPRPVERVDRATDGERSTERVHPDRSVSDQARRTRVVPAQHRRERMRGDSAPPIVRSEQDQRALLDRLERMRVPSAEPRSVEREDRATDDERSIERAHSDRTIPDQAPQPIGVPAQHRRERMRGDSAPPIIRSEQDRRALLDRLERMRVPPAELRPVERVDRATDGVRSIERARPERSSSPVDWGRLLRAQRDEPLRRALEFNQLLTELSRREMQTSESAREVTPYRDRRHRLRRSELPLLLQPPDRVLDRAGQAWRELLVENPMATPLGVLEGLRRTLVTAIEIIGAILGFILEPPDLLSGAQEWYASLSDEEREDLRDLLLLNRRGMELLGDLIRSEIDDPRVAHALLDVVMAPFDDVAEHIVRAYHEMETGTPVEASAQITEFTVGFLLLLAETLQVARSARMQRLAQRLDALGTQLRATYRRVRSRLPRQFPLAGSGGSGSRSAAIRRRRRRGTIIVPEQRAGGSAVAEGRISGGVTDGAEAPRPDGPPTGRAAGEAESPASVSSAGADAGEAAAGRTQRATEATAADAARVSSTERAYHGALTGTRETALREIFGAERLRNLLAGFQLLDERLSSAIGVVLRRTRGGRGLTPAAADAALERLRRRVLAIIPADRPPGSAAALTTTQRSELIDLLREARSIARGRWNVLRGRLWRELYRDEGVRSALHMMENDRLIRLPRGFPATDSPPLALAANRDGVIWLRTSEGVPADQIGREMGLSASAVQARLTAIRADIAAGHSVPPLVRELPLNLDHITPIQLNPFNFFDPNNLRVINASFNDTYLRLYQLRSPFPMTDDPLEAWIRSFQLY